MKKNILIEIIASSFEDAIAIEKAGANRIELLINMKNGGTTPPLELVKKVCDVVKIPVRVMVRDEYSSFVYDEKTMESHIDFINKLKKNTKAEGIVFGSLNKDNSINVEQLQKIINVKGHLKLTFHRAFDQTEESKIIENLKLLQKYKVDTLLTSGLKSTALLGKDNLKKLVSSSNKIEILIGSSVSIKNVKELVEYTNANSIHIGSSVKENNIISIKLIKEIQAVFN